MGYDQVSCTEEELAPEEARFVSAVEGSRQAGTLWVGALSPLAAVAGRVHTRHSARRLAAAPRPAAACSGMWRGQTEGVRGTAVTQQQRRFARNTSMHTGTHRRPSCGDCSGGVAEDAVVDVSVWHHTVAVHPQTGEEQRQANGASCEEQVAHSWSGGGAH